MAEALVEYDYKAQEPDELTLKKGDTITDIKFKSGGWWEGSLKTGKRGMFPDSFVKLIKTEDGALTNSSGRKCKVLFSYKPENKDELELQPGDIIDIVGEVEEGWWKGVLRGRVGVFPSNFVSEITEVKAEREAPLRKPKLSRDESTKSNKGMSSTNSSPDGLSPGKAENAPDLLPSLPPKPPREYCRVLFKYTAANADELSLKEGDVISILAKEGQDPGWWKGELRGKMGVFPDNFVELISLEEATKSELKTKVTNRFGVSLSKSATTSSISENISVNSLSRKFSDTSRSSEDKVPPSVSKKPLLPPPPNKKPAPTVLTTTKVVETSQPGAGSGGKLVTTSSTSIKHQPGGGTASVSESSTKWTVHESSDAADGLMWSKQSSYSMSKSEKSIGENGVSGVSLTTLEGGGGSELNLDMVGRSSRKLSHPTASRAKAPKRRPPSGIYSVTREDLKNGGGEDDDGEGETDEGEEGHQDGDSTLVNGDADPGEKKEKSPGAPPPWVEELKLNQAKKSQQGKTRVLITSSSERSVSSLATSIATSTLSEKSLSTSTHSEKSVSSTSSTTSPSSEKESRVSERLERLEKQQEENEASSRSVVTLRGSGGTTSGGGAPRPHSMISTFSRPSSVASDTITLPIKQWNELQEKLESLESKFDRSLDELRRTVKELSEQLLTERQKRAVLEQEVEKLTDIVTQV